MIKEMSEPNENGNKLAEAKSEFSREMLSNDIFFDIVKNRIEHGSLKNVDLDDFSCEPTYKFNQDGTSDIGVRIACSTSAKVPEASLGVKFSQFSYVDIAAINETTGVAKPSQNILEEVEFIQDLDESEDKRGRAKEALISLIETWQRSYNIIIRNSGEKLTIDPISKTVITSKEARNHPIDSEGK